ncbi:FtsX-like permease family protein [Imhoffiella purpurea]|uniref:AttF component of AttEFGH ABC transport system / AttG component of AttEFGH ABC transport system n=1 Tax=Imhoffiella purpurea TaxID=1249627 RepID=W9VFT1_9GAMM|nr:FtsX-like permease family protein [Imhoffiella purpurea]EXJ14887.1 AttF component of AttEFGH ABC transport system / AttG component of AttEFGH ABC transport system [Imhoffiella purpurea]
MTLAPVFLGSLARRRTATLFSFVAILLGVALGMAVQAVNQAALSEFGRGMRTMAGAADLQVVGPRGGFDEGLYATLAARSEVAQASPVLEMRTERIGSADGLRILGIDLFAAGPVTPALLPRPAEIQDGSDRDTRLAALAEDSLFLSMAAREALQVDPGDRIQVHAEDRTLTLRVAGDLPGAPDDPRLAVMDIAAVQKHFSRIGRLTRIDLRLAGGQDAQTARAALEPLLPAGLMLEVPEAAVDQAANLSRAYRVNLTMLAAIALVTGGFLVFSAQALSVVRRHTELAFLRAIGLARRQLFLWLLAEGALVGLLGGLAGVALGHGIALGLLTLLGGDLGAGFFSGLSPTLRFSPWASAAYVLLGIGAGVAGAWLPAREAAAVAPARALKSGDDSALSGGRGVPMLSLAMLTASLPACFIPPIQGLPLGGYLAIACLLAGAVMLLPTLASMLARTLPLRGPVPARLAAARLAAAPGQSVIAATGVLASVALVAAMAIMVGSFRDSVDVWLGQILPADLYLRAGRAQSAGSLDEALQARLGKIPGVARVQFTAFESLRLEPGRAPVELLARPVSPDGDGLPLVGSARPAAKGETQIWISEAMRDLYGWRPGERVLIPLAGDEVAVQVAGVWRDYARQGGAIMMDLADYRRLTGDASVQTAAIWLAPGADGIRVGEALKSTSDSGALEVAFPGEIRERSLTIFDRTFVVTYVLEAAAVVIGLAGVAASFAALTAARRREFGMLRHLGLTRRQIGAMLALEGTLAAGVGVLGGLAAGGAISLILIEVVNRQSFHWSMDLHLPWASLLWFAGLLVALAGLAAILAGRQAMREDALLAVREDW